MSEGGRLAIIIEADATKLESALTRANSNIAGFTAAGSRQFAAFRAQIDPVGVAAETMGKSIDRANAYLASGKITVAQHATALKLAADAYDAVKVAAEGSVAGHKASADAAGLNRNQLLELTHVARSAFDSLASGASPIRVLAQEGGRLSQALGAGEGGLGGGLATIGRLLFTPIAGAVALGAGLLALIGIEQQYEAQQRKTQAVLRGYGAASGETLASLNALTQAEADAGHASVDLAQKAEAAFLKAGASKDDLQPGIDVLKDFAAQAGQTAPDALNTLAGAYADPAKFADEFGGSLLNLTATQIQHIHQLQEQGEKTKATAELMRDIGAASKGAGEDLKNGFGRALDTVSDKLSGFVAGLGQMLYRLTHDLPAADEILALQQRKQEQVSGNAALGRDSSKDPIVADLEAQIAKATAASAPAVAAAAKRAADQAAAKRGRETDALVDKASPDVKRRRDLVDERAGLVSRLSDPGAGSSYSRADIQKGIADVDRSIKALDTKGQKKPPRPKRGPADTTNAEDAASTKAADDAEVDYTNAVKAAATAARRRAEAFTIEGQLALAQGQADEEAKDTKDAISAELKKQLDGIAAQRKKIDDAPNDKDKVLQEALLAVATARYTEAARIKTQTAEADRLHAREIAAREADIAQVQKEIANYDVIQSAVISHAQAEGAYAVTLKDQRDSALRVIALEEDRANKDARAALTTAQDKLKGSSAPDAGAKLTELNANYARDQAIRDQGVSDQRRKATYDTASPLEVFTRNAQKDVADINTAFENAAVEGIADLNSGITDAITAGKSMRDVFKAVFADMEKALISYLLKQAELGALKSLGFGGESGVSGGGFDLGGLLGGILGSGPAGGSGGLQAADLVKGLPGFAEGGVVPGVGGPTSDSVLARLSPGEVVLPNSLLSNLNRGVPQRSVASTTNVFHLHAEGAVMTPDLISGLNAQAAELARQARVGAVQDSSKAFPKRLASFQKLGT